MGNRAVITTKAKEIGVYLHWNGGHDSVEAFLAFCEASGFRCPEDDCYGWAYLCTVLGCFFGDGLSLGIDKYDRLDTDNKDNGVYIIKEWKIVGREHMHHPEQQGYRWSTMLRQINERMPKHMRLSEKRLSQLCSQQNEE